MEERRWALVAAAGGVDALAPRWRPAPLFDEEIPAPKQLGLGDEQIETMLVTNPARWLAA